MSLLVFFSWVTQQSLIWWSSVHLLLLFTRWNKVRFLLKINVILLISNQPRKDFLKEMKPSAGLANKSWWGNGFEHSQVTELKTSMYREIILVAGISDMANVLQFNRKITALNPTRRLVGICGATSLWNSKWPSFWSTFWPSFVPSVMNKI